MPETFDFSEALRLIREGKRVSRLGWNGKNMFVFSVLGSTFEVSRPPLLGIYPEGTEITYRSRIDMCIGDGEIVPWSCTHSDILSDDWMIAE